jgi:hypothetical protein
MYELFYFSFIIKLIWAKEAKNDKKLNVLDLKSKN